MTDKKDELIFAAETKHVDPPHNTKPWKLLVVDDDEFVHKVTRLVFAEYRFEERPVEILSAHSAEEGKEMLSNHPDIAVVLLDVVMETHTAGLEVAAWTRDVLGNTMVRIIMRTGQPGEAPEQDVIFKYDINDYKEKSELTSQKLVTTVTAAIRSYRDIRTIEHNRRGLARIVKSTPTLFKAQSLNEFASGVLTQLSSTISEEDNSLLVRASGLAACKNHGKLQVVASTGRFNNGLGYGIEQIKDVEAVECINRALKEKSSFFTGNSFTGYFRTTSGSENIIHLTVAPPLKKQDRELIDIFSTNIAVAFDNIDTNEEMTETQRELLLTIGEAVEMRSTSLTSHVRRVSEYAYILARHIGMETNRAEILRLAAPMHDIGKIGSPEHILYKQETLDPEEMESIKSHTEIGYEILKGSNRKILQTAASIAKEHHEHWDGSGYPNGLKNDEISLEARIVALVDVFDVLGSKRIHKGPWSDEDILAYIEEQKGIRFDPELVNAFMDNLEDMYSIRKQYPDSI